MLLQQNLFVIIWTAKVFVKSTNQNLLDKVLLDNKTDKDSTRIVYERAFLMNLRNSPISRTPPRNTLTIPTELLKGNTPAIMKDPAKNINKDSLVIEESAEQFEMDM